jgi:hypothetical protein
MARDRKQTNKTRPKPSGLDGLGGHLLKDLWGVTPDQLAVVRGLPTQCDGVGILLRMGRQEDRRQGRIPGR